MITLTRRYRFSAAHVLARPDWSEERNRDVYGQCANPAGHGHNYGLEVTVRGQLDPAIGRLLPIERLDAVVQERVLRPLDHRFLNREVPAFESVVPTLENIARYVWEALKGEIAPAVLHRVRLEETLNNSVEYSGPKEDA
jgi:6-pyruvoyltetrahydropterin/6-carboxytetrahydropterin synthase